LPRFARTTLSVLAFLLFAATAAASAREIGIGINYNWWKFTLIGPRECKAEQQPRSVGTWILPAYDDPSVRRIVKSQLQAMHSSGFTTLRIVIFHGHSSDPDPTAFTSMDGSLSRGDRDKLSAFVSDVASAGFKTLEIVPDFGAENGVFCRTQAWGDCFDAARTNENWQFIERSTETTVAAAGPMSVRTDIANEAAPDPTMPARTLEHTKTYLQTIASRFRAKFGDSWLISASRSNASPATETAARLTLLVDDLAEAGLTPRYLELHDYSADGNDMKVSLNAVQALAQRIGASIVLGELRYHSDVQSSAIAGWLKANPSSRIVDLIQWPEYDPTHVCGIDPVPPYTPGALGAVRGGASP
jgi:hypothetical protein